MKNSTNQPNPSAVFGEGIAKAFKSLGRVFTRSGGTPPVKAKSGAISDAPAPRLDTILLPAARTRWMGTRAANMTPAQIESILTDALTARSPRREKELFDLMMDTWPRLMKATAELKEAVLQLDCMIQEPEDAMPGMKELMERAQNGMRGDPIHDGQGWRGTLSELLDAWFRGVAISEIVWETRGGANGRPVAMLPRMTRDLPVWHYGWNTGPMGHDGEPDPNADGRLVFYPTASAVNGQDFQPDKFLIAIRKARKGHPSGGALLRPLAWFWCAANFSAEWLLNFAQVFGQPFRWANYDPASPNAREELAEMMEKMGAAAWGVGPTGSKVEFHETNSNGKDNPQAYMLDIADRACDLLILGQTLTTSEGSSGSRALGEVHGGVRSDLIDAAAGWLAEVLNEQLAVSIARLNFGAIADEAALPFWDFSRKTVHDPEKRGKAIQIARELGLHVPRLWAHEALDIPVPNDGEEILTAGTAAPEPVPGVAPGDEPAELSPELRAVLARMPLDAREYFRNRIQAARKP